MITLLHGSDIVASRTYFLEEKQKYPTEEILDGEKINLTDLTQIFEGGGLFEEHKTVFIEHFFNRKKKKEEFAQLSKYLDKQSTHTIFLWEGKELEKSSLMVFKSATPRAFKLPQTLFIFLDSFKPGNGQALITLFHQTLATTDVEMLFFMLVRQIRLLLALSDARHSGERQRLQNPDSGQTRMTDEPIDELKRLAPWQKTKLEQQAKIFSKSSLLELYGKLFELEVAQKTGTLTRNLALSIDFLLLEL